MIFEHTYTTLPQTFFTAVAPTKAIQPKIVLYNTALAKSLAIPEDFYSANFLTGSQLYGNSQPIAMAYAGHQFGGFNKLGDGRAILLGEHRHNNQLIDVQLKGSGPTPYSRRGDGLATLSAMLREYLFSEAIHGLNIPTSRSLAVTTTGNQVYRQAAHHGAVLTRLAASHIRVGTFEYAANFGSLANVQAILNYSINRHYPQLLNATNQAIAFLQAVMLQQIQLVTNWLRVGFIHGVLNTDNLFISGQTLDYGPCAFLNQYNPATVFSSIDVNGRYAFGNQAKITLWNLTRLAETLLPLINTNQDAAVAQATETLNQFEPLFTNSWQVMMANKLGFATSSPQIQTLAQNLLQIMQQHKTDYTNTFVYLANNTLHQSPAFITPQFNAWYQQWLQLHGGVLSPQAKNIMQQNNPFIIPRSHLVEDFLEQTCQTNNPTNLTNYINHLQTPYNYHTQTTYLHQPPPPDFETHYKTFCNT
jgi:serine/tyrosine/threonine adenylyltransferase